jgi:tRNA dimethylallyltransferase
MIEDGLVEEVSALYARGYSPKLNSLQSLGYRHVGMILSGEMEREEAIRLMKRDTRRYAKRQLTWFRSEPEVMWFDPEDITGIGATVSCFLERR